MRDFVILGSSSIVTPQKDDHHHHHHNGHRHRSLNPKPNSKHSISPSRSILGAIRSRSPLLTAIRYDLTPRLHKSRLKYYADLAAKLAGDGRLYDFSMILESLAAQGVDVSDFVALLSRESVAEGVLLSLRDGNVHAVLEAFKEVDKLGVSPAELFDQVNVELFRGECGRIAKCKRLREVVEFLEKLAGFGFLIKELVDPTEIVKMCVDQRDLDLAVRYADIRPYDRVVLCTIISEFGKRKDLASALTAYEAFTKILSSPNMYMCRTIIDVCAMCGNYMKSRLIFEGLLKQNIRPNTYVFNSLMNANAHDLTYTMHIYQHMQNLGVKADTASYNVILKSCCLAGRVDLAEDIYNKLRLMESTGSLKLDVFTYCTIIKVFSDAKLWQMALKVKDDMLSSGVAPNMFTWSALISACANAGLVEHAIQLFEEMLQSGCEPNTRCCNILLHACVEARQYDRAFRLFHNWKQNGVQRTPREICTSEADNIHEAVPAESGSSSAALEIVSNSHHLNFIKKFPFRPTKSTYSTLMEACGTDYERAKALMYEMKREGLFPDKISWSILIHMCGASGNAKRAVQTLKEMRYAGVEPDGIAYTTAIKVCVESRKLQLAFSLFAEMKRNRLKPDLMTYNTLLRARIRYGSLQEVQQCLAIYQEMRKAGYEANDYYLKRLIEEWCEGVVQRNGPRQGRESRQRRNVSERPQILVLEKVAAHLQKGITGKMAINLQGLTSVESRIVVLAVLRMTKENYYLGHPVADDILIILGVEEAGAESATGQKDAILKLLQSDLGLEVLAAFTGSTADMKEGVQKKLGSSPRRKEKVGSTMKVALSSPRRPMMLPRLTITKESLIDWAKKTAGTSRE